MCNAEFGIMVTWWNLQIMFGSYNQVSTGVCGGITGIINTERPLHIDRRDLSRMGLNTFKELERIAMLVGIC